MHAVLVLGSALWCLAILAAPAVSLHAVYDFFSTICHQDPTRTWFFFGEPLPVCIRCASIYFGFLAALLLQLSPHPRWLLVSIALLLIEFLIARLFLDSATARALTGVAFGMAAAPFVQQGLKEMLGRRVIRESV